MIFRDVEGRFEGRQLNHHGRAHSVVRPYVCPEHKRLKRYSDLPSLNKHTETHREADLTSGPKTLLSELKRVIEENDSRNTNIKSFHDNEIFPFRLENQDIWQLIYHRAKGL